MGRSGDGNVNYLVGIDKFVKEAGGLCILRPEHFCLNKASALESVCDTRFYQLGAEGRHNHIDGGFVKACFKVALAADACV